MGMSPKKSCVYFVKFSTVCTDSTFEKILKENQQKPPLQVDKILLKILRPSGLYQTVLVYSDDDERVSFFSNCVLEGAVEIWLTRLLDFHCETVRLWLKAAVTSYEVASDVIFTRTLNETDFFQDKPREEWIFDYPAQIVLTASQIWFFSKRTI